MHHPMPDRFELETLPLTAEELGQVLHRAVVTEPDTLAPALLPGDDAPRGAGDEMR